MACFHLHQRRGSAFIPDKEGAEWPDLEAARNEALLAAREVMRETLQQGFIPLSWCFEITDEYDQLLMRVTFADAVQLRP